MKTVTSTTRASVQANLEFRWSELIRSRLEGLTDEEYLWEPAVGSLSVRPDGTGGFTIDPVRSSELPLGNIAWRMAHLALCLSTHPVAAVAFGPDWPAPQLAEPAGTPTTRFSTSSSMSRPRPYSAELTSACSATFTGTSTATHS